VLRLIPDQMDLLLRRVVCAFTFLSVTMSDIVFVLFIEFVIRHGGSVHSSPKDDSFVKG
jgi:hypothetical protein